MAQTRVEATWRWDPAFRGGRDQGRAALLKIAARILETATARAPRDTGDLRASGFVEQKNGRAVVGFTDWKAAIVHERQANYRVGQWKFLESAASELEGKVAGEIGREISGALSS